MPIEPRDSWFSLKHVLAWGDGEIYGGRALIGLFCRNAGGLVKLRIPYVIHGTQHLGAKFQEQKDKNPDQQLRSLSTYSVDKEV